MLKERSFRTGSLRLRYAEGPPSGASLLLLHGLTLRWQSFLSLIPFLVRKWHVYALDFRGHGASEHTPGQYQFHRFVDDVTTFVDKRIEAPIILFGHSLGGATALASAARLGNAVRGLIVADNFLFWDTHQEFRTSPMMVALFSSLRKQIQRKRSAEDRPFTLAEIAIPVSASGATCRLGDLPGYPEALLQDWAKCLAQVDEGAISVFLDETPREQFDGETMLRQLTCPLLLLQANPELGSLLPDKDIERAKAIYPLTSHGRFEHLGHMMQMQDAHEIIPVVLNFLKSLQ